MHFQRGFNTLKWFQVMIYNTNNLTAVICLHTVKWRYIYDL